MPNNAFRFHSVAHAPLDAGVYAWYCCHSLSRRNIDDVVADLTDAKECDRPEIVLRFLNKYIFSYFSEQPYRVRLSGALKPNYEGDIRHTPQVSRPLLERIARDPQRLIAIAETLPRAMPNFLSPIYIGSARSLRSRLSTHCDLIRKYRDGILLMSQHCLSETSEELRLDHSFAHEVAVVRRFDPNDLWAYTLPMPHGESSAVDIENLLNRMSFPLCGRN